MFPREMVILMAIARARYSGGKLLIHKTNGAGDYIADLYNSLVTRGYLEENGSREYQLTSKGRGALFDFLRANSTRVEDTIQTLQQLGIAIS